VWQSATIKLTLEQAVRFALRCGGRRRCRGTRYPRNTPSSSVLCAMELADYLRDQAATCRQFVEQTDDPVVKNEMLELASLPITSKII
jgi:hypothetical protein